MTRPEKNLTDYHAALRRVLAAIEGSLEQPLKLEQLAAIACFSPFHFQRIFHAFVGDTVMGYVQRRRLELAAQALSHSQDAVTAIALSAGFETPAAFSRAFRQRFGTSPSDWRQQGLQVAAFQFTPSEHVMLEMEFREALPRTVLCVQRTAKTLNGTSYADAAQAAWQALWQEIGPRQLVGPTTEMLGICLDDPDAVPVAECRYEAAITVPPETAASGELLRDTLPGGRFAVFLHRGTYQNLGKTWTAIWRDWLPASPVVLRHAAPFERYLNDPQQVPESELLTEIWVPIA